MKKIIFLCVLTASLLFCGCMRTVPALSESDIPTDAAPNIQTDAADDDTVRLTWDSGERILLYSQDGFSVYMKKHTSPPFSLYAIEAENSTDFTFTGYINSLCFDDRIDIGKYNSFSIPKNITEAEHDIIDLGMAACTALDSHEKISFTLSLYKVDDEVSPVFKDRMFEITVPEENRNSIDNPEVRNILETAKLPIYGIRTEEQVIFDSEGIRVTLLALGKGVYDPVGGVVSVENFTNETQTVELKYLSVNNNTMPFDIVNKITVEPGHIAYHDFNISSLAVTPYNIVNVDEMSLMFIYRSPESAAAEFSEYRWCNVEFLEVTEKDQIYGDNDVVYDDHGIRIIKTRCEDASTIFLGTRFKFHMIIENNTDKNINVHGADLLVNQVPHGNASLYTQISAGNIGYCVIIINNEQITNVDEIAFTFSVCDFSDTELIFTENDPVTVVFDP